VPPVLWGVDVDRVLGIRAENEGCDQLRAGADQAACADIPGHAHDLTPQVAANHHGRLDDTAHADRRRGPARDGVKLEQAIEKLRAYSELIPHDDHGALDVRTESSKPGSQRGAHPRGMVWVDKGSGSAPTDPLGDQLVIGAENDHDLIKLRGAGHGDDVLQQWPALEGEELLGLAHPQRGAGSEHDPGARDGHQLITAASTSRGAVILSSCYSSLYPINYQLVILQGRKNQNILTTVIQFL